MRNIVTVITGGHGGMGSAAAKELGEDSILVLASREEAALNRTKSEMDDLGYETQTFAHRRMDQSIKKVLSGRKVDDIKVGEEGEQA